MKKTVQRIIPAALEEAGAEPPGKGKRGPEQRQRAHRRVGDQILKSKSKNHSQMETQLYPIAAKKPRLLNGQVTCEAREHSAQIGLHIS
jgi:hypothetical protein